MSIINTLTKEEVRNFKLFLRRSNSSVSSAPVAKLFDCLRQNQFKDDKAILERRFSNTKPNAFYRLKNRLLTDLNKSLLVLNHDKNDRIIILNNIILSEIFLYKSEYAIAYKFLCKAEKKAKQNEFYSTLENIYEQMIGLSKQYFDLPLLDILERKRAVVEKKRKINTINDMMAEIRWRLQKSNYTAQETDIIVELDSIKNKLDNIHLIENSPSLKIKVQENIRMILLQKGDIKSLDRYLSEKLKEFEQDGLFNKNNHNQKIVMQTWLINTNIKLLNFHLAYQYAEQLKKSLHEYKKLYYDSYIWTYYQCIFGACFYSNQLDRCLMILKTYSNEEVLQEHSLYHTYFNLNSAVVYFCMKNTKRANSYLNKLLEPELYDSLSQEMRLTVRIVELLFYYENDDFKYVNLALKQLKQKQQKTLSLEKFSRQNEFLKVLGNLSKDDKIKKLKTIDTINHFIENSPPFEVSSDEAIDFKFWLISKKDKKDYYTILINSLQKAQTLVEK